MSPFQQTVGGMFGSAIGGSPKLLHCLEEKMPPRTDTKSLPSGLAVQKHLQNFGLILIEIHSGHMQILEKQHRLEQALPGQAICQLPALRMAFFSALLGSAAGLGPTALYPRI